MKNTERNEERPADAGQTAPAAPPASRAAEGTASAGNARRLAEPGAAGRPARSLLGRFRNARAASAARRAHAAARREERMLALCRAFLAKRRLVAAAFLAAAALLACCIPLVKVNYSLTDYLPADAASVQSLDQMEESFGGGVPNARLYAEGIGVAQAQRLSEALAEIDGVDEVMWLGSVADVKTPLPLIDDDVRDAWTSDDGYLFQLTVDESKAIAAFEQARAAASDAGASQASLAGSAVSTANAQESSSSEIVFILAAATAIIVAILLLASHSWLEPAIFLVVVGIAIVMNMGSNVVTGEISFISQICGAILQLAVSMDYAIVLLHTFRRCQRDHADPAEAMAHAMAKGFTVVLSSAAVTFFGFLSLTVMRFGVGVDMGVVLAKGIVFSFLAVMFFMPCLILLCLKPLDALSHRYLVPSFDAFARVCQRAMVPMAAVVVLAAVPAFLAEREVSFVYGSSDFAAPGSQAAIEQERIDDAFGASETWALMVPEGRWSQEQALLDDLEGIDGVAGATSYITVAGRAMPVDAVPADQADQVISDGWSRMVLTVDAAGESDAAFSLVEQVRAAAASHYGDDYRLVGNTVSVYDLRDTVHEDTGRVQFFCMASIGIVLALMFRSLSIPFLVLAAIEMAVWMNMAVPYFAGESLNYIGYLVIDAVQLGAAVDYAIIYAREYFDRRAEYGPSEAARSAVKHAATPILTSASILTFAGIAVWQLSSNGVISEIGVLIARGAFISMTMMFVFLPWLFKTFDGAIRRTTAGLHVHEGPDAGVSKGVLDHA